MIDMTLLTIKRLASDIMKVGVNKVRIDPENIGRANEALTRNDVRVLISDGVVYAMPKGGRRANKKRHGGKGHGSRKGSKNSRTPQKRDWMARVRSQRKYLVQLVADNSVNKKDKRNIYMKIKSGIFKSKKSMHVYLTENNLMVEKEKK